MFNNLTDFAYKRNKKEAFGFYLAYLLLALLFGALSGGMLALVTGRDDFGFGIGIGVVIAICVSVIIPILVLSKKHLLNNFGYLLLIPVSGLLALLGGCILGLIPSAYLTTKGSK